MQKLQLKHRFDLEDNQFIYDNLLDLSKFGEFHPKMVEVTPIGKNTKDGVTYLVKEAVTLLGFIKLKPQYEADVVETVKGEEIIYYAHIKGDVYLKIIWRFEKNSDLKLVVYENIAVTGNPLVALIFIKLLKKSHLLTIEKMKIASRQQVKVN